MKIILAAARPGAKKRRTGGGGRQSAYPHSLRPPHAPPPGPGGGLPVPCPALGVRVGTGPWAARLPSPTPPSLRWSELRFGFETGAPPTHTHTHTSPVSAADPAWHARHAWSCSVWPLGRTLHEPRTRHHALKRNLGGARRTEDCVWRLQAHLGARRTGDKPWTPPRTPKAIGTRLRRLAEARRRPQGDPARRDLNSAQPREGARPEARLAVVDPWESKRNSRKRDLLQVPRSPHSSRPGAKMRRFGGGGAAPLPPPPPAPSRPTQPLLSGGRGELAETGPRGGEGGAGWGVRSQAAMAGRGRGSGDRKGGGCRGVD